MQINNEKNDSYSSCSFFLSILKKMVNYDVIVVSIGAVFPLQAKWWIYFVERATNFSLSLPLIHTPRGFGELFLAVQKDAGGGVIPKIKWKNYTH